MCGPGTNTIATHTGASAQFAHVRLQRDGAGTAADDGGGERLEQRPAVIARDEPADNAPGAGGGRYQADEGHAAGPENDREPRGRHGTGRREDDGRRGGQVLRLVESGSKSLALQRPVHCLVDSTHQRADPAHVQGDGFDGGNPGPLAVPVVEQRQGCPRRDEGGVSPETFVEAAHGDQRHRRRLPVVEQEGGRAQDQVEIAGIVVGRHVPDSLRFHVFPSTA